MEVACRGVSAAKSTGCPSRGLGSIPRAYMVAHKSFETSVPGGLVPFLISVGICMQAVHLYTHLNINLNK